MSKYDTLDARTELEQAIAEDLKAAMEKRWNCSVWRLGGADPHTPARRERRSKGFAAFLRA